MSRPPMWWQREPPPGWRYARDVSRTIVMFEPWDESKCDVIIMTPFGPQPHRMGWCTVHAHDGSWFELIGGGSHRPQIKRGLVRLPEANNGDDYTMRLAGEGER